MKTRSYRVFSDQALRAKTGKDWDEWLALVQAWGGGEKRLTAIRNYLIEQYHMEPAWAEIVVLQYRLETLWRGTSASR
jgi:hypothetical protein